MPRGVTASASPRVPNLCVAIAKNASGGGCFGEPPSAKFMCRDCEERLGGGCFGEPPIAKFMCRDCEERLGGWLLRRAPECQIYVSRLRRTPRGVAASASLRVPN